MVGGLLLFIPALLLYVAVYMELGAYVLGAVAGIPFIVAFIRYPKFWLHFVAVSSGVFFISTGEGVSALDVVFLLTHVGGILIWLGWQVFVERRKLMRNIADWLIVFFFIALWLNLAIAWLNEVELIYWFREYFLLTATLYYFPFREYFNTPEKLKKILISFAIAILIVAFYQFWMYYKAITSQNVLYAYQLGTSVRINQAILTSASMIGLLMVLEIKKLLPRLLMVAFTVVSVAGLIASFSRTFWAILLFGIFVIFIYVSYRKKIMLIWSTFITFFIFAFGVIVVMDQDAGILFQVIENRFTSTSRGIQDISVQSRLSEYDALFNRIAENPLGGNGLSSGFHFYNPITQTTLHTAIIHNGYFYLAYRIGIPLTLCYLAFLFYYFFRSEWLIRKLDDEFMKSLALGAFVSLLAIFIANITSSQFQSRDGMFVIIVSIVIISLCENQYKKEKLANSENYGKE